jgi:hypothetical protein
MCTTSLEPTLALVHQRLARGLVGSHALRRAHLGGTGLVGMVEDLCERLDDHRARRGPDVCTGAARATAVGQTVAAQHPVLLRLMARQRIRHPSRVVQTRLARLPQGLEGFPSRSAARILQADRALAPLHHQGSGQHPGALRGPRDPFRG